MLITLHPGPISHLIKLFEPERHLKGALCYSALVSNFSITIETYFFLKPYEKAFFQEQ